MASRTLRHLVSTRVREALSVPIVRRLTLDPEDQDRIVKLHLRFVLTTLAMGLPSAGQDRSHCNPVSTHAGLHFGVRRQCGLGLLLRERKG